MTFPSVVVHWHHIYMYMYVLYYDSHYCCTYCVQILELARDKGDAILNIGILPLSKHIAHSSCHCILHRVPHCSFKCTGLRCFHVAFRLFPSVTPTVWLSDIVITESKLCMTKRNFMCTGGATSCMWTNSISISLHNYTRIHKDITWCDNAVFNKWCTNSSILEILNELLDH